ncbi:hypothetical protein M5K25_025045 [Dendrobium thyrsiflorum]|uniref:Uncharacterized protein n=1 Tax=Dendrobium thyrsiflorum TaxID=117978 RepID=A0ABD0U3I8_DENTH
MEEIDTRSSCVKAAFSISIPHRKLLKDVITSLCISSIAFFHLLAKSFTKGSTSETDDFSMLELDSSSDVVMD